MKINVKFTICLLLALIICSGATYLTNRAVVKKKIQQITKQKLENITNSVLHFIEKEETSMQNLEKIINKEINIGKLVLWLL